MNRKVGIKEKVNKQNVYIHIYIYLKAGESENVRAEQMWPTTLFTQVYKGFTSSQNVINRNISKDGVYSESQLTHIYIIILLTLKTRSFAHIYLYLNFSRCISMYLNVHTNRRICIYIE